MLFVLLLVGRFVKPYGCYFVVERFEVHAVFAESPFGRSSARIADSPSSLADFTRRISRFIVAGRADHGVVSLGVVAGVGRV